MLAHANLYTTYRGAAGGKRDGRSEMIYQHRRLGPEILHIYITKYNACVHDGRTKRTGNALRPTNNVRVEPQSRPGRRSANNEYRNRICFRFRTPPANVIFIYPYYNKRYVCHPSAPQILLSRR